MSPMSKIAFPAMVSFFVLGCLSATREPVPPGDVRADTPQRAARDSGLGARRLPDTGDTEEMLIPDPALRTWNRLWSLRNWIRRYVAANGALPTSMRDFVPKGEGGIDPERDGWGNRISYRVTGTGYELRSSGPDGTAGTEDDMIATREHLPARPDEHLP